MFFRVFVLGFTLAYSVPGYSQTPCHNFSGRWKGKCSVTTPPVHIYDDTIDIFQDGCERFALGPDVFSDKTAYTHSEMRKENFVTSRNVLRKMDWSEIRQAVLLYANEQNSISDVQTNSLFNVQQSLTWHVLSIASKDELTVKRTSKLYSTFSKDYLSSENIPHELYTKMELCRYSRVAVE